jgi:hypothetical protein
MMQSWQPRRPNIRVGSKPCSAMCGRTISVNKRFCAGCATEIQKRIEMLVERIEVEKQRLEQAALGEAA